MKLVFDANVLVAAFAARGLCAELFEACLAGHVIATSEHILQETGAALKRKIRLPAPRVAAVLSFLRQHLRVVPPAPLGETECRDRDDLAVLGTAVAAQAECLVTGDRDLLDIGTFRGIPILAPRALWERLREADEG